MKTKDHKFSKKIINFIEFENIYPKPDTLEIFSKRYEISHVLNGESEKILIPKILQIFPKCLAKRELIATTYFEKAINFEPKQTCIIRFRQRAPFEFSVDTFKIPKTWTLSGSGNLEIKVRNNHSKNVSKMASFLPSEKGKDIYSLFRLSRKKSPDGLLNFVKLSNDIQLRSINFKSRNLLKLITPKMMLKISKFFTPYATRVNVRETFELLENKAKITVETHPIYFVYPIVHRAFEESPFCQKYIGIFSECPDRTKIEIKTASKIIGKLIETKLYSVFKDHKIFRNKLTNIPFSKMILNASELRGSLVYEHAGCEIEMKGIVPNKVNISELILKIRKTLLRENVPYKLFITDPDIGIRGEEELNRTIIGWKDTQGNWHEVVTIIRLTKNGCKEQGCPLILKWKGDTQRKSDNVLYRLEKKEFVIKNLTNTQVLQMASKTVGKKLQVAGVFRKIKYRIMVQDKNGRNFNISLDKSQNSNHMRVLQQMEVEYCHTISVNANHKSSESVYDSCIRCMDYFTKELAKQGVNVEKTNLRKIDFFGK